MYDSEVLVQIQNGDCLQGNNALTSICPSWRPSLPWRAGEGIKDATPQLHIVSVSITAFWKVY